MLLIRFATRIYLIRTELEQPFIQLPRRPIEPIRQRRPNFHNVTHFGYELSPNPNDAKLTPSRKVGGSRFKRSDLQNDRAFAGKSPCPVVETTNIVMVYKFSASYRGQCKAVDNGVSHTGLK